MFGRRRHRSRDRGGPGRRRYLVIGLLVLLPAAMILPSGAFSLIDAARNSNLGVASDSNAELGLVITDPVQNCERQDLVEVTNDFNQNIEVTVSLNDGSIGTLYDPNNDSGDSVTFTLASGNSGIVELDADYTGSLPTTFGFDISASGSALSVTAPRTSTLEGSGSCGGGPPGGGGGPP